MSECGDGRVVGDEDCDDDNQSNADRCNSDCTGSVDGWYCSGGGVGS